jgi:AraC-like DNA-binding protein
MESAVIFIGISQSIFAAVLMFIKRPLNVADKILGFWLIAIALLFIENAFKIRENLSHEVSLWPISINLLLTYPQFLFLYAKYITKQYAKFKRKDLVHFLPTLIGIIIVAIQYDPSISNLTELAFHYKKLEFTRSFLGISMIVCIWLYTLASTRLIYYYKKQRSNAYSFDSHTISLTWLFVVVISIFIYFHVMIISTRYDERFFILEHLELFRSGTLLIFVYIVSLWGLKQRQLISISRPVSLNKAITFKESDPDRYQKSGLKDDQAEVYLQKLIEYMDKAEAWKDNELSVAKLSEETGIPKHYITQVLNENLKKNFYTFVNEYRTEYAKKLIASEQYEAWSFVAIAYESGFNSKTAFNSFFKKYTDMTPTEYRNQISTTSE